ncbi:MAG: TonB-dependent receptor [bacterium]
MHFRVKLWSFLVLLLVIPVMIYAGTTGKIRGRVVDDRGNLVPYAQVMVLNTSFGGLTNAQGEFDIIGVPPGTYTVQAAMIGFTPAQKAGVVVHVDRTTDVGPMTLRSEALEIGIEVTTYGQRIIATDVTATEVTVNAEQMEALGIDQFAEALTRSTSATRQGGDIHVRGGRGGEVLYMVDGMSVRDPLFGNFSIDISSNAVQEMNIIAGGFNAEYGQAQSGVVNVVTREGSRTNYSGRLSYKTDKFAGTDRDYSFNSDRYEFSLGGPEPLSRLLLGRGEEGRESGYLTFFISTTGYWYNTGTPYVGFNNDFDYAQNRYSPDSTNYRGWVTPGDFLLQSDIMEDNKLFPLRQYNRYTSNAKLAYLLTSTKKLIFSFNKTWKWQVPYEHEYKYNVVNEMVAQDIAYQWTLGWNHTISSKAFYNLKFGFFHNTAARDHGHNPDYWYPGTFPEEIFVRREQYDGIRFLNQGEYDQWVAWSRRQVKRWSLMGDFSWQFNRENLIKFGGSFDYYQLQYHSIQYPYLYYTGAIQPEPWEPYPDQGVFRNCYKAEPMGGAIYLQDKLETEGMIINVGMRLDFWVPGDAFSNYPDPLSGDTVETTNKYDFSPRLGIAFPVTDKDKLYFSYGRFIQLPELQYMYGANQQGTSALKIYTNPDIDAEKTVQYEIGLDHAFNSYSKVSVRAFFKDIRGLVGLMSGGTPPFDGQIYTNLDYGNVRGFDFSFEKNVRNYWGVGLGYTMQWAYGKGSSERDNYLLDDPKEIPLKTYPLNWDERHAVTGDLTLQAGEGEKMFGFVPDKWTFSIECQYGSGFPYTPSTDNPDYDLLAGKNYMRMPYHIEWNLNFIKNFSYGPVDYGFTVNVDNLFNRRNVLVVNEDTGTWNGNGSEIQSDPTNRSDPRRIMVGFFASF